MRTALRLFKGFLNFVVLLVQRKHLILEMAKREMATQYMGSALGFFWTFINPLVMIFILWFIFSIGFKAKPMGNVPFVVWLTAAMAIWNTFSDVISTSTVAISSNTHLVKKVVFPLSILPVVRLVASLVTHVVFLAVLIALIILYDLPLSIYWLQALYYFFAMACLALSISWITSSLNVFVRDTSHVVNVILQFAFWGTPIFWNVEIMPEGLRFFLKLNPMYYIVQGYRDSFIYFVPFWADWRLTLYFWLFTGCAFALGALVFLRLRPHLADVV